MITNHDLVLVFNLTSINNLNPVVQIKINFA
jgi:hypothetical protein